jgi:hypothetical protein
VLYTLYAIVLLSISSFAFSLHVLHLSFHKGCIDEINFVAQKLNFKVTSLFIPAIMPGEWDGYTTGNALYNVGHERALRIWNKHKDYFNQFDAIITSDTAPLARVFLQNNYTKPLIIWICNRFDYVDNGSLDCDFPDEEYYQLLRESRYKKNVYMIPYTAFESFYAVYKNIECDDIIIQPIGARLFNQIGESAIPSYIKKQSTFFIPPYLNDTAVNVSQECAFLNIDTYNGRYNGPRDLQEFKGIIHIPYAWSNVAFFENTYYELPYFVPSPQFMGDLYSQGIAWWANGNFFKDHYLLSEWYSPQNSEIITYFDSWEDLKYKIDNTDFTALRLKIKQYAQEHLTTMLYRWNNIFNEISQN